MIHNYLTVAIRNLFRYKGYAFINVFGLAIGMACCVLMGLYAEHELSFDRGFPDGDQIYRVLRELHAKGSSREFDPSTSGPLAQAMENEIPEVESAIRFRTADARLMTEGDAVEGRFAIADVDVLSFFGIEMLKGDPGTALAKPWSLVLTERMAMNLFGSQEAIGQTVTVETGYYSGDYTVTGIVSDFQQATVQFSALTGFIDVRPFNRRRVDEWRSVAWRSYITLFKLRDRNDAELVAKKLEDVMVRHMGQETLAKGRYYIQPLQEVHLYTRRDFPEIRIVNFGLEERTAGDIDRVYLFSTAALFVLLVACVNFINLTTARAETRVREIGMRKVVGASRVQLIRQFLAESLVTTFLALVVGLALAMFSLPYVNSYVGRELDFASLVSLRSSIGLLILGCVVGLAAGGYPAVFLSSMRPVHVMKGFDDPRRRSSLRHALVVFQFAVSIVLVIATLVVRQQLRYAEAKPLGFQKDLLITMPIFGYLPVARRRNYNDVKQAFLGHPGVLKASASRRTMGARGQGGLRDVYREGQIDRPLRMRINSSDADFLDVYQIPLLAGRSYSSTALSGGEPYSRMVYDQPYSDVVINRTAARQLGWEDPGSGSGAGPVGKRLIWVHDAKRQVTCLIVGVMEDFHTESLRERIQPLVYNLVPVVFNLLTVRISSEGVPETLSFLEKTWKRFLPDRPFTYSFVDENLDELYQQERRFARALFVFSALAIFIAGLGLLGLAAYLVRSKTKEIGIRKAVGASEASICRLLSNQLVRGVLISSVVALPVAYWAMEKWLQGFAYRTSQGPAPSLVGIVGAFVLALLVMSFHALRAARANPVEALRCE